jgi:hypothetical protein
MVTFFLVVVGDETVVEMTGAAGELDPAFELTSLIFMLMLFDPTSELWKTSRAIYRHEAYPGKRCHDQRVC